ncbi:MAG: SLC13 family permease [Bacteroidetes bacterium]|nr:SLC13 family permease [Bacteroidota bacterium]
MTIIKILLGPCIAWIAAFLTAEVLQHPELFSITFSTVWMLIWWVTQAVPMPITALLPLILFPGLNILDLKSTAAAYGHEVVFLFLGGFLLALGLEKYHVHTATAKWILHKTGNQPKRLLLGFSLATAVLSMWISNTATTMMMLPMALSVFPFVRGSWAPQFRKRLLLALAYSSSIGGVATLIGTPPNAVLRGMSEQFAGISLGFFPWMVIGLPLAALLLLVMYLLLSQKWDDKNIEVDFSEQNLFGSPTALNPSQKRLIGIFIISIAGWMFGPWIGRWLNLPISDAGVALIGALLLFIVPADQRGLGHKTQALLEWADTQKLAWGVILLFGGGFALAKGLESSGMIQILTDGLLSLGISNPLVLILLFSVSALFLTELMSNVALVTLMVPVVISAAQTLGLHPLFFALPVTLASSMAFMFPMATPPNAIVFGGSDLLRVRDMVSFGFFLNMLALITLTIICLLVFQAFPGLVS